MTEVSSAKRYDVVIIGAGPAGYVCAIRCAQLGMRTACIDRWMDEQGRLAPGGTCLNAGCIPSKALLDSSHHVAFLREQAQEHGIKIGGLEVDVPVMQRRKDEVVRALTGGVAGLLKKNKVDVFTGSAGFISAQRVKVHNEFDDSLTVLQGEHVIIASGSKPIEMPVAVVDGKTILDSTGALDMQEVPEHLVVIGAGAIGLEMGSVWKRLGSEVIILEAMPEFLPMADHVISKEAFKILNRQGLEIHLDSVVKEVAVNNGNKTLVKYVVGDEEKLIKADKIITAVGRRANTEGLGTEAVGIATDHRGFVQVDSNWRTSVANVYAIGDVIGGAMLAHKGSEEGIALAEQLVGQAACVNSDVIPWVIYTWPEIAWVGMTEKECKNTNVEYRVGAFPFTASGRARVLGDVRGLIKIIGDRNTDRILGVHIVGPNASELISEAVVAMESELSTEDIARTIHAHPSLAEGLHEAALAVDERAIHF